VLFNFNFTKTHCIVSAFALALAGCQTLPPAQPLACNDSIKTAFKPDAKTTVVSVRQVKKDETIIAVDSPVPIKMAADMCLVKLLVGPGATVEKDKTARSYTEGIGIEIWLPTHANWNERIRDYGGGGWVGGGHRYADKIGSKVPALANANMGFAVGTTDSGQPHSQDGSFMFLSDGKLNFEALRDKWTNATVEQAKKTRALTELYYAKKPKFTYFDGHSQGGRQALKLAQEFPELYDGFMVGQPAVSVTRFSMAGHYPQMVMKADLGFDALTPAAAPGAKTPAALFADKVNLAIGRSVEACDKEQLGFLLDPFSCNYDPARDAAVLCTGVAGNGVTGANDFPATCMNVKEADALNKIWYGATRDGAYDANQTAAERSGTALAANQLWWGFTRGAGIAGGLTRAGTGAETLALALQDVSYAPPSIVNTSTSERNKWSTLTYADLAAAQQKALAMDKELGGMATESTDLSKLKSLGRKVLMHTGLAEDSIPPATSIHYYTNVVARMGGMAATQDFFRMYMVPGAAHSSQGRAHTVSGRNNTVPLPKLPGNTNQNPTREQDQMFTALQDWVEKGIAPGEIVLTSRDNSVSYPVCVYPKKISWDGVGSSKVAASYSCK
jgi:pimeloyl-ACP methyl ester carboxylesterase